MNIQDIIDAAKKLFLGTPHVAVLGIFLPSILISMTIIPLSAVSILLNVAYFFCYVSAIRQYYFRQEDKKGSY